MKCPNCGRPLKQEIYAKQIVFRCPDCGGRMISFSCLRKISGVPDFIELLWKTAKNGYSKAGCECAVCRRPMRRVVLPLGGKALELDVCCVCQTVWFDPAELERIPLLASEAKEEPPLEFREQLALLRNQLEKERIELAFDGSHGGLHAPKENWKRLAGWFGFPTKQDEPALRRTPFVTWGIALVCLIVFLLTCSHLQQMIDAWGFIPSEWSRKGGLTFATSALLHGGVLHLVWNLYFLLMFGDNAEDELGWFRYFILLAASGLCASILLMVFNPTSTVPCIGASGVVSGAIAFHAVRFPHVRLSFLFMPFGLSGALIGLRSWISFPAWLLFGLWLLLQIAAGIFMNGAEDASAYLAHAGGALPGILCAICCRIKRSSP